MNSSFYIFGRFNGKKEQYPADYTKELFQSLPQRHFFTHSQLVIHRDGKLLTNQQAIKQTASSLFAQLSPKESFGCSLDERKVFKTDTSEMRILSD